MSIISSLVHKDLIDLNNRSNSIEEFFKTVSNVLLNDNFVEDSFENAIITRERAYPTGLELPKIKIAIPHTDTQHIIKPFIYVNRINSSSLRFCQMGTDDVYVNPEFVIVLGIKNPKEQVGLLSNLIEKFSDDNFIETISSASNEEEIYRIFKNS